MPRRFLKMFLGPFSQCPKCILRHVQKKRSSIFGYNPEGSSIVPSLKEQQKNCPLQRKLKSVANREGRTRQKLEQAAERAVPERRPLADQDGARNPIRSQNIAGFGVRHTSSLTKWYARIESPAWLACYTQVSYCEGVQDKGKRPKKLP